MKDLLTAILTALAALGPLPWSGWCYTYHPYPDPWGRSMRQVAARRGIALNPEVDGYASTPRCDWIGGYLTARLAGQLVRLQVIDCSAPADLPHQLRARAQGGLGLILEVDWSLAAAQGWAIYGGAHGDGRAPAIIYSWQPALPIHIQTIGGRVILDRRMIALAGAHARRDAARLDT